MSQMLIKTLQLGAIETNCYIVSDPDSLECAVIDPGDESNVVLDYLEANKLKCSRIFLTHGHFDHTLAAREVSEQTGAAIYINKADANMSGSKSESYKFSPPDGTAFYGEGDSFEVGSLRFEVFQTPGHSPGSVTLLCGGALFTGDTLFKDSCGRTDLSGGDMRILMASLKRLYELPGDYEVYPGHMDSSTLERERRFNYYMKYSMES